MLTNPSGVAPRRTLVRRLGVATGLAALVAGPSTPVLAAPAERSAAGAVAESAGGQVAVGVDATVRMKSTSWRDGIGRTLLGWSGSSWSVGTWNGAAWPGEPWH